MTSILPPLNSYQASHSCIDIWTTGGGVARITNKNLCRGNLSRNGGGGSFISDARFVEREK